MYPTQTEELTISRKKIESLYTKHINLGREAYIKGDRVLSESNYQHAEYYLQLLKESDASFSPMPCTSERKPSAEMINKIITDIQLKGKSSEKTSDSQPTPSRQRRVRYTGKRELRLVSDEAADHGSASHEKTPETRENIS